MSRIVRAGVIEAPEPFVELATVKAHLRVDHDDDDTLIEAYIAAACAHIDGPGGWLERAIGVQTLEVRSDTFSAPGCNTLDLPFPPVIDVVSVNYLDAEGAEQTLDAADYAVTGGYTLRPAYDGAWPTVLGYADAVRIQYRAGYVVDPVADPLVAAIPAQITAAVLLMVGDLYQNRETTIPKDGATAIPMSTTVERLLAPFRWWAL
jgi:uncharacterized phiE125 gp8 family phage protein